MFTYVFVMPSILQSQLIEKGFKKTENFEYNLVLLLFLYIYIYFKKMVIQGQDLILQK